MKVGICGSDKNPYFGICDITVNTFNLQLMPMGIPKLSVCYLTYSMVTEVVKIFNQDLFEDIQISNENVGLLTNVKPALIA